MDHPRTGADLARFDASVRIECRGCGSALIYGPDEFARTCGTGSLGIIAKHLECASCGAKRAQLIVLPAAATPPLKRRAAS